MFIPVCDDYVSHKLLHSSCCALLGHVHLVPPGSAGLGGLIGPGLGLPCFVFRLVTHKCVGYVL